VSLPALITAMLHPEFYPHRPDTVTLAQTHISYVLLAGDQVYKVKKPVRFSFLDFSTLTRRRHFCHEEVRLNRRLAQDAYLGVVAICQRGDAFQLGDMDDPAAVEYAVHMRRLPADRMLDQLLDRNAATPEMIDALAARLADFHRAADAGPAVAANGDPAAIWRVLQDNYTNAQPFRGVTIAAADDDAIQAFSRSFLERHDTLLRTRQATGRIRDGHGDLHTEHICYRDGLTIFDCIEFNEAFRYCDVASDIAFLAMDLEYHGHPELAAHLVSRYAAYAGDADLERLVPFYQCYRAYVRGKVDSLKSVEEEVGPSERAAARRSAWRHFALAYRCTWAYSPCLVAIAGLSGTGKSAVAATLHARTGFAHLNSDVVRKRLAGVPATAHATGAYEAGLYTSAHSARTYRTMLADAAAQLAAGHGVILDATFQRRADRDAARTLAQTHGVPIVIVECRCSEEEVRHRLSQRAHRGDSPSDADWSIYLEQRRCYEAFGADEAADHLVLDTTAPTADLNATIEAELRRRATPTLGVKMQ
jgi:aminoglycoside phosphotransferase family enzyme/predicted kinase